MNNVLQMKAAKSQPPAQASLSGYVDGLFRNLSQLLPVALEKSNPKAIHRVRVTTRRLSSVVDLLHPRLKAGERRAVEQDLKKLRRRLGRIRDIDVMLGQLRRYRKQYPEAVGWLAKRLEEQRNKARARLRRKRLAGIARRSSQNGMGKAVAAAEKMALPVLGRVVRRQFSDFCKRADELVLGNRTKLKAVVDVHALRIAGKRLRYGLELAAAAGAPLRDEERKHLKRIQDVLGGWHDQAVLADCALEAASKENLALVNSNLLRELLVFVQDISGSSQEQIEAFIGAWERDRGKLSAAIAVLGRGASKKGNDEPVSGEARKIA
jgi:CHAD domain-containing protein